MGNRNGAEIHRELRTLPVTKNVVMFTGKIFAILPTAGLLFPCDVGHKVLFPKNLIHQHPQVVLLVVVYGDENYAVVGQQFA